MKKSTVMGFVGIGGILLFIMTLPPLVTQMSGNFLIIYVLVFISSWGFIVMLATRYFERKEAQNEKNN